MLCGQLLRAAPHPRLACAGVYFLGNRHPGAMQGGFMPGGVTTEQQSNDSLQLSSFQGLGFKSVFILSLGNQKPRVCLGQKIIPAKFRPNPSTFGATFLRKTEECRGTPCRNGVASRPCMWGLRPLGGSLRDLSSPPEPP